MKFTPNKNAMGVRIDGIDLSKPVSPKGPNYIDGPEDLLSPDKFGKRTAGTSELPKPNGSAKNPGRVAGAPCSFPICTN
jgi:hypothetical protein